MTAPFYRDDSVTLYHGDCRELTAWHDADVLITDPPYGRGWKQGGGMTDGTGRHGSNKPHPGIAGDRDTAVEDEYCERARLRLSQGVMT